MGLTVGLRSNRGQKDMTWEDVSGRELVLKERACGFLEKERGTNRSDWRLVSNSSVMVSQGGI